VNWRDQVAEARHGLESKLPYFAVGLRQLRLAECIGLGTMGITASGVLLCDPARVAEWYANRTLAWVLLHELLHLLLEHSERRGDRDPQLWNIAADAEDNGRVLATPAATLPTGCVTYAGLGLPAGLTAEEVYRQLLERPRPRPGGEQGKQGEGEGEGEGEQQGEGEAKPGAGRPRLSRSRSGAGGSKPLGKGSPKGSSWEPRCGSGAGGEPLPGEAEAEKQVGGGHSPAAIKRLKREVAEAIEAGKGRGSVPGEWAAWADGVLRPPKIPWQTALRRLVRARLQHRAGAVDYTYRRPSRRQGGVGFGTGRPVLRGLHAPVPRLAIVVDTSGSMLGEPIRKAVGEVAGIVRAVGAEILLYAADAAVAGCAKVDSVQALRRVTLPGGGGTDFRPALDAVTRARPRVDACIYLTDGDGAFGEAPIGLKVIWVMVAGPRPVPYGEVLIAED